MVAGALTGALFKSTGEYLPTCRLLIRPQRLPCLALPPSWCEACLGSSHYCLSIRGGLELDEDTGLSTLYCAV